MNSQIAICVFKKRNYNTEVDSVEDTIFGTSEYSYFVDDETLKEGDIVVVETIYGIEIAKFIRYSNKPVDMRNANAWLIQKINLTAFLDRKEKEIQRQALIEQMRAIKDSSMEMEIFATLAKSSPQMAQLLEKYNSV